MMDFLPQDSGYLRKSHRLLITLGVVTGTTASTMTLLKNGRQQE